MENNKKIKSTLLQIALLIFAICVLVLFVIEIFTEINFPQWLNSIAMLLLSLAIVINLIVAYNKSKAKDTKEAYK